MECEYSFEELKRCDYCKRWIEYKFIQMTYNRKFFYFHRDCFEIITRNSQ